MGRCASCVGLVGAGVGVLLIKAIPAPNMRLTSYASGYDLLTGHPHLAWKGWAIVAAALVGFAVGSSLYRRNANERPSPPSPNAYFLLYRFNAYLLARFLLSLCYSFSTLLSSSLPLNI